MSYSVPLKKEHITIYFALLVLYEQAKDGCGCCSSLDFSQDDTEVCFAVLADYLSSHGIQQGDSIR